MSLLWLVGFAHAGACCASVGAQPTLLADCDGLAVAFGAGGDVEYGGWSWAGAWSPVGDDGGGNAVVSAAILGRFTPWLQGGVRLPVNLVVDQLDGEATTNLGLGSGLLWIDLESPPDWLRGGPQLAVEFGVGTDGAASTSPGAKVIQGGLRAAQEVGGTAVTANLNGRWPVLGAGVPDADLSLGVDHAVRADLRLGGGVGVLVTGGASPGWSLALGPSLAVAPTHTDRLLVAVRAGLPVSALGRNAPTRFLATLDWYRVLAPARVAG